MTSTTEPLLLLVDDNPVVLRVMARHFSRLGVRVLVARDAGTAEGHLKTSAVTHVVCDFDLGLDQPNGTELVRRWKATYPSIKKACLYTGSGLVAVPAGVDCIFHKPTAPEKMMSELGIPVLGGVNRRTPEEVSGPLAEEVTVQRGRARASRRR